MLIGISLWSFPILVGGLSTAGFGLLSLVWVLVGYFSLLDFGVSRAITKYVAESLAAKDLPQVRRLIWTSLSLGTLLGLAITLLIILSRDLVVTRFFGMQGPAGEEAKISLVIAGVGIPFMLSNGMIRGIQMAYQRFDMANAFQALMGGTQWLGSVGLVWMGYGVKEIVLLTVAIRVVALVAGVLILPVFVTGLYDAFRLWETGIAKRLLSFGGWVTVSQVVSPLFMYIDRFLIVSFISLAAVAYYTVPQETVNRMLILPLSLANALYPVFSAHSASQRGEASEIYHRSLRYSVLVMVPLTILFLVHAKFILVVWMGAEFAAQSVAAFQILVAGFLFNALAQMPTTVLHAYGRPDLTAKFHLIELPVSVLLNVLLIPILGIAGAALAWAIRVTLDALLVTLATRPYVGGPRGMWKPGLTAYMATLAAAGVGISFLDTDAARLIATGALLLACVAGTWKWGLDQADRAFVVAKLLRRAG